MKKELLRRCPFCGGPGCIFPRRGHRYVAYRVFCAWCHIETPTYMNRDAAKRTWNTRTTNEKRKRTKAKA